MFDSVQDMYPAGTCKATSKSRLILRKYAMYCSTRNFSGFAAVQAQRASSRARSPGFPREGPNRSRAESEPLLSLIARALSPRLRRTKDRGHWASEPEQGNRSGHATVLPENWPDIWPQRPFEALRLCVLQSSSGTAVGISAISGPAWTLDNGGMISRA